MAQVSFSGKRELRWLQEGDCLITFVEADVAISDALWDQWLAAMVAAPGKKRLLASWGDIQPTKDQWRRATRTIRDSKLKIAVVTESRPTSALTKAASWAGADMLSFRWEQLYEAGIGLDFDGPRRMAVRTSVTALRDCFGAVDGRATPSTSARPAAAPIPASGPLSSPGPSAPTRSPASSSAPARPAAKPSAPSRPVATASPSARPTTTTASPTNSRPVARTPEPQRSGSTRPIANTAASRTPMADAASKNLAQVRQTSEEIQAKLAEIQARLRNRTRA
jgi:hypothetical protein